MTPSSKAQVRLHIESRLRNLLWHVQNCGTRGEAQWLDDIYQEADGFADLLDEAESAAREETLREFAEVVSERVKEWHKDCLTDQFINGRFWEAHDIRGLLWSLTQETPKA